MIVDVLSEIKEIKLQLKNDQQINLQNEEQISIFINNELNFPLQTEEDLQIAERLLEDEAETTKETNELQGLGGNNGYEFIRRVLTMILTNKLANDYSFFGRKKKKSFCDLNICKVVINAAKKGKYCNDTKEVEKNIAGWLRRAAERGKIRM
ncbi:PREDICTED: uncharacterized protein LOC108782920 [Cyphomyrmex costatus]|uniref:uncharacterized protein LOC108782920 n=1 Tax=Cyphomyrmex costatus TaxID=456900 RepID=UPI000852364A|nr:PREDICTED: uncharacterized protein LOC108782920 [Cyphomyrmex costatus]